MKFSQATLLFLFFLCSMRLTAQERFILQPTISANYSSDLPADLTDSSGNYSFQRYQLGIRTPLWIHYREADSSGKSNLFLLSANANGSYGDFRMSENLGRKDLYGLNVGLTGMLLQRRKNLFSLTVAALNRGDAANFKEMQVRFSGLALYRRMVSKRFNFHVGVGYSYFTGRAIAFPALGMGLKTGEKSRLNINFPGRIQFSQLIGKSFVAQAYIRQQGGFYGVDFQSSNTLFGNASYLRMREGQLGISAKYRLNKSFRVSADAGYNFRRSLRVAEDLEKNSALNYSSGVENGPYFGIGIQYRIGSGKSRKEKQEEDAEREELLSDPDFYSIILN